MKLVPSLNAAYFERAKAHHPPPERLGNTSARREHAPAAAGFVIFRGHTEQSEGMPLASLL
jgi:hypothetical protein